MRRCTNVNIISSDASTDQPGVAVEADQIFGASAQAVVTGSSAAGTLFLQGSNQIITNTPANGAPATLTIWSNISTTYQIAIAGAGTYLLPFQTVGYAYIRCNFVHTAGSSGTITVNLFTQGV